MVNHLSTTMLAEETDRGLLRAGGKLVVSSTASQYHWWMNHSSRGGERSDDGVEIGCRPPDFAELLIFNSSSELKIFQIYLIDSLTTPGTVFFIYDLCKLIEID
jgi:hypothetical protein